jgi:hypothetical protein
MGRSRTRNLVHKKREFEAFELKINIPDLIRLEQVKIDEVKNEPWDD